MKGGAFGYKIFPEELLMLQLVSLVLLAYSFFFIQTSIPKLPARIPVHFNASGVADGWGGPQTLWVLLGAQALTCAVFLVVPYLSQRSPNSVHFGSRKLTDFPPEQRVRMVAMLNDMAGYLAIVMNLFFAGMIHKVIQAAADPAPHLDMHWMGILLVAATLGITFYYLWRFRRAAQGKDADQ